MHIINPILTGSNPDPSICRVGLDYYIATSTFEWYPGVRIHHSRDLVNWRLLTHPLRRLSQLNLKGNPDSCGVWAPNLTHHEGLYYLLFTDVKCFDGRWKDSHNYLITASRIEGEWSSPIYLNSSGFDPSMFHDDDGRAWVVNLLVDHRNGKFFGGIVLQEYSYDQQCLIGDVFHIFDGSQLDITEGPVIYKKDEYYYLMTAEGGTDYDHAVTIARSHMLTGPYEIHPHNPLLTSSQKPTLLLQKAGHGSLVRTLDDRWYMAHLTSRPLSMRGRSILGRETALQEIVWKKDGWPYLKSGGNEPAVIVDTPHLAPCIWEENEYTDFAAGLSPQFQSLRIPMTEEWLSLSRRQGYLAMKGQESLCSTHTQSLIARRQAHFQVEITVELEFTPNTFQQMAGITYYYNTRHFYYLYLSWNESLKNNVLNLLINDDNRWSEPLPQVLQIPQNRVWMKLILDYATLRFTYSLDGLNWQSVGDVCDASIISDDYVCKKNEYKAAFTGAFIGMCCQDLSGCGIWAYFKSYEYNSKP